MTRLPSCIPVKFGPSCFRFLVPPGTDQSGNKVINQLHDNTGLRALPNPRASSACRTRQQYDFVTQFADGLLRDSGWVDKYVTPWHRCTDSSINLYVSTAHITRYIQNGAGGHVNLGCGRRMQQMNGTSEIA